MFIKALAAQFPKLAIEDGDTPMQQARMIKLPEEIVLLEEATAIADAVTRDRDRDGCGRRARMRGRGAKPCARCSGSAANTPT